MFCTGAAADLFPLHQNSCRHVFFIVFSTQKELLSLFYAVCAVLFQLRFAAKHLCKTPAVLTRRALPAFRPARAKQKESHGSCRGSLF